MSYMALYRKRTRSYYNNAEESDKGGQDRTCISVLWHKRNRKDIDSKVVCKSSKL